MKQVYASEGGALSKIWNEIGSWRLQFLLKHRNGEKLNKIKYLKDLSLSLFACKITKPLKCHLIPKPKLKKMNENDEMIKISYWQAMKFFTNAILYTWCLFTIFFTRFFDSKVIRKIKQRQHWNPCRNPNFGFAIKAKGVARVRAKRKPGSHITCSRECRKVWGSEPSHSQGNSHFGRWSPSGLPKFQRTISRVKTQWLMTFFISLDSPWNLNV